MTSIRRLFEQNVCGLILITSGSGKMLSREGLDEKI